MRNNQKRMRGRHNNNHRKSQNPLTRVYESNGPDVKIRGTANHIADKYIQLARDSQSSGDPVAAENYYQHAEHYFRLIAAAQEQFRQQNPYYNQQQPQNGAPQGGQGGDEGFDGDDDGDIGQSMNGQNEPHAPREQAQPYMPRENGGQNFGGNNNNGQNSGGQNFQHRDNRDNGGGQNFQPRHQGGNQQPYPPRHQQSDNPDPGALPSFITGGQPQQGGGDNGGQNGQNGQDFGGNDRFGGRRHRRRHRGPRPEGQYGQGGNGAPVNDGGDEPPPHPGE
jgi:hypothetical protein